jgi:peptidoglycan/xylan/chitin deacetylase (PgdA/CDA1 family)
MEHLRFTGQVVSYDQALDTLRSGRVPPRDQVVLTFDDGYRDFYTHAFPVLAALGLPATLFVATQFIDEGVPCVMSSPPAQPLLPVTWSMLRKMHASGLVTVASHTHTHVELPGHSPARVVDELTRPQRLLEEHLGAAVRHFAYPRAVWDTAVEAHVRRVYDSAAIAGSMKTTVVDFDSYRIRRLPILRRDGWFYFRAKLRGWLERE